MRPRLLHLGYQFNRIDTFRCQRSFNEAEAFTPRIRRASLGLRRARDGASMRPRLLHLGYRHPNVQRRPYLHASMRPRLLHLGYGPGDGNHALQRPASMRPRLLHLGYPPSVRPASRRRASFNEAEAFTPRIQASILCLQKSGRASMRPRLLHLGYVQTSRAVCIKRRLLQ